METDTEWWRGAVIYQIYPRSFADSNDDGIGDLPGIVALLDYVASLGVDAIWISPFFTSPMKDYGYDVADYRDVDPIFGTLADCDALIKRAHELGLRVLVDLVFSHTSDAHSWFAESRSDTSNAKRDWYVWADPKAEGSPPNNWQSVFGGPAWTWDPRRGQYYMHNFLSSQPQLNGHHPEVQSALLDIVQYWLDRGIDGFRLDAINYAMHNPALIDNPPLPADIGARTRPFDFQIHLHNQSQPEIPAFLASIRALVDQHGGALLVGEIGGEWSANEMKAYTADARHLHSAYSFEFLFAPALTPDHVADALGKWTGEPGEGWPSWAFSNHDAPRVASRWRSAGGTLLPPKLSLMLLMCLRGNIFIYQGEELGLPQSEVPFHQLRDPEAIANWPANLGRDGARTPMPWRKDAPYGGFSTAEPWLPVDRSHLQMAVSTQTADATSMVAFARELVGIRRASAALRWGSFELLVTDKALLVFERSADQERYICLFNLGDEPVDLAAFSVGEIVARTCSTNDNPTTLGARSGIIAVRRARLDA